MWVLDPANAGDLLDRLRPHARVELEVLWVGEGWRPLVEECHERLVAAFPEYELAVVKQKYGELVYDALPHRGRGFTPAEAAAVDAITEEFQRRSESVCEWCGEPGSLRDWRRLELTLCDRCDARFADPPYELHGSLPPEPQ